MSSAPSVPVVVIDSNIVVSALISPGGSSWQVLDAWEQRACHAVSSSDLNAELSDVLSRPRLRAMFRVSRRVADRYLDAFIACQIQPFSLDAFRSIAVTQRTTYFWLVPWRRKWTSLSRTMPICWC